MCCGAAGRAYLWPPLSSGGASRARPWSVSTSRSSNRTCGFPASGSRTRATLSPTESYAFGPPGGPVPTFHRDIRRGTAHDEIIRKVDDVRPVALHPTPLFPTQNKPPDVQIGQQGRQRGPSIRRDERYSKRRSSRYQSCRSSNRTAANFPTAHRAEISRFEIHARTGLPKGRSTQTRSLGTYRCRTIPTITTSGCQVCESSAPE